ncbi:hypothetical protein ABT024_29380 [Streptomyces sp. NPDC002812]|uniref:hypothetical protein n=1 Tax=Streptomyces TaxID=1883 RepID=UPI0033320555
MSGLLCTLLVLLALAAAATNPVLVVRGRRRLRRLADHARGLAVTVPCDLRDRELTDGQWREGHLKLPPGGPGGPVHWRAKGRTAWEGAGGFPPLEAASADELSVAFRSADGATELRLHPDEAPMVLRVLRAAP